MQIFQSWLDTILIFGLLVTNLVFIAIYRRQIESLKCRNEELERTNKSSLELASERATSIQAFKGLYDPDYFKKYLEIHVKVEVEKAKAAQQVDLNNAQIRELLEYLNEAITFFSFHLYVEKKYSNEERVKFFHKYFDKSKDIFWYTTNAKIEKVEKKYNQSQSENHDA